MATFEYLRLSLSVPTIGKLAEEENRREPSISRKQFLLHAFSKRRDFFHRKNLISFVPSPAATQGTDGVFSGYFGRATDVTRGSGPEEYFRRHLEEDYRSSFVAINIEPDQQLVAAEKRSEVGDSKALLSAFFRAYVRELKSFSWHTDVEYLSNRSTFWSKAHEFRGEISELRIDLYPSNGLQASDRFKRFKALDKENKNQMNAEMSSYTLKNKEKQLDISGTFVEEAVEYVSEGGGSAKLKSGRKLIYNSQNNRKTENIPESLMPRGAEPSKILGLLRMLLP